jgi:hypothetical protein
VLNVLYFVLTLAAVGLAVWYGGFYQPSTPETDYHVTYVWLSICAAVIFTGLLAARIFGRGRKKRDILLEKETNTSF